MLELRTFHRLDLDSCGLSPSLSRFLERHTSPFADLSVWAAALSGPPKQVWAAFEQGEIVALASLCGISDVDNRVFWSVKGVSPDVERELIEHLVASGSLQQGVTVCPAHLVTQYERLGRIAYRKPVRHLGMPIANWSPAPVEVHRPAIEELDAFYKNWHNKNWHEGQFLRGPHIGIRRNSELVAAFGTQAAFPGVIHVGNAFVDPQHRGQGLLKLALAGLFNVIAEDHPEAMVSLYVGEEAAFTVPVYERLGLTTRHMLTELEWAVDA